MQKTVVEVIEQLENDIYKKYDTDHKPRGKVWLYIVLDLARLISENVNLDDITETVLEELTADNFHTARHAAETILHLKKYILP